MDVKVYRKEEVKQPSGSEYVYVPDVIDIIPEFEEESLPETRELLSNAVTVEAERDILEQECALATIFQKGLDPLAVDEGIRWSEVLLGEINVVQLMEDLTNAVAEVTPSVTVVFDTVTDSNGNTFLKYSLKAVA